MKKFTLIVISLLLFALVKISIAEPPEPPPAPAFPGESPQTSDDSSTTGGGPPETSLGGGPSAGGQDVPEIGLGSEPSADAGLNKRDDQGEGADVTGACKPCNDIIQEYIIENKGKDILFILLVILNFILIVLNFILIVLLLKFLSDYKKKQKNDDEIKKQSNQKKDSDMMDLKDYIKNCLDKGYNPETIKQLLLKNDFPEETIDKALNESRKW